MIKEYGYKSKTLEYGRRLWEKLQKDAKKSLSFWKLKYRKCYSCQENAKSDAHAQLEAIAKGNRSIQADNKMKERETQTEINHT